MSYDPFAPASRRHARRRTVPAPPDPLDQVPGNEREVVEWTTPVDGLDLAELADRVALARRVETVRGGGARPAVVEHLDAVTELLGEDDPEAAPADALTGDAGPAQAGRTDGKGPRRRMPENDGRGDDTPNDGDIEGPEAGAAVDDEPDVAGTYTPADVPPTAVDAARWVRSATNPADGVARATLAWEIEQARPDGVRGTVQHEVAKHLDDVAAP